MKILDFDKDKFFEKLTPLMTNEDGENPEIGDQVRIKRPEIMGKIVDIGVYDDGREKFYIVTDDGRNVSTGPNNIIVVQKLIDGSMGGINRSRPAQDVSYEHVLDGNKTNKPFTKVVGEKVKTEPPQPGATKDEKYKGWNLRYQIAPKTGNNEVQGMAVHAKSSKTPPVRASAKTPEEVVKILQDKIDNFQSNNKITSNSVTIDFNKHLSQDIIGHSGEIFADIIEVNNKPCLILSPEQLGGMYRAIDRTSLSQRREDNGLHKFNFPGKKAANLGLTHARYRLGQPFEYMDGIQAYPLEFDSEVHPGEAVKLNEPGLTITQ